MYSIRKEFEAWIKSEWQKTSLNRCDAEYILSVGQYACWEVECCWRSWQASRESLVINLPVMPKAQRSDEEATFSAGGCDMLSKCIKSIEAAGLKVTQ